MSTVNMLLRKLRLLVDRTLLLRVSYAGAIRRLQISPQAGVAQSDIEHLEPAGFSSHPLEGAEAVVVNLGGNSGRAVVIVVNDRRHRIVLDAGESAIYNMPHGDFVKVKSDRSIHVKSAVSVLLETPLAECSQDMLVRGDLDCDGDVRAGNISLRHHRTSSVQRGGQISDGPVP